MTLLRYTSRTPEDFELNEIFIPIIQLFNAIITIPIIFINLPEKMNIYPDSKYYLNISLAIFFSILISCIVERILTYYRDKKLKTEKLEKCKRDLLIGHGGIAICEIIPQIVILIAGANPYIMTSCVLICMLVPMLLFVLFILPHHFFYKVKKNQRGQKSCVTAFMTLIHIVYFIIIFIIAQSCYNRKDAEAIFICFFWFAIFCSANTTEFIAICKQGIEMEEQQNDRNQEMLLKSSRLRPAANTPQRPSRVRAAVVDKEVHIPISDDINSKSTGLECDVCMLEYSNQVIPRILKECGHTVCEECVGNLIKNEAEPILCPFCRKATSVPDGLPNRLPKNYAILEMIQRKANIST